MDSSRDSASWFKRALQLRPSRPPPSEVVFPAGFLNLLERLRIASLKTLGGMRQGHRLGVHKGGQLEFHGHRNYAAGDDLRYVDWNSYARLGRPYVKEFARDEAGVLHLLMDATASMSIGVPSKWTFARRVAALFWHAATSGHDNARICIFDGNGVIHSFHAANSAAGIHPCMKFLKSARLAQPAVSSSGDEGAGTKGALNAAVEHFLRQRPQRGRVIVISDFWHEQDQIVLALSRLAAAGFDIGGIHVLAPEEILPEVRGDVLAESVEGEGTVPLSLNANLMRTYASELEHHQCAVEEVFRRRGGSYLFNSSATPIETVLIAQLRQSRWLV